MQGYHWFFLLIVLIVGMFIEAYFSPLGMVGIA